MKQNFILVVSMLLVSLTIRAAEQDHKIAERRRMIEELRQLQEQSQSIAGNVGYWSSHPHSGESKPIRKYFTDKGLFIVYPGNVLDGHNLLGPLKRMPSHENCTDSAAFEQHLKECGFKITKIELFN